MDTIKSQKELNEELATLFDLYQESQLTVQKALERVKDTYDQAIIEGDEEMKKYKDAYNTVTVQYEEALANYNKLDALVLDLYYDGIAFDLEKYKEDYYDITKYYGD